MDVLVDLDGTLVDPKPGLIGSVQYALEKLGRPVPPAEDLLWLIGPPLRIDREKLGYPAPAPALGSDSRAVLTQAGLAPADIDRLVADGVVVAP